MLHLQKLLFLVRSPASPVHSSLHRALLSSAAVGASPVHFAAEDYLVDTCGLTKEQAAKAAKHIAHCKSPCNANAVLSFLASPALGLSKAEIAHFIAQDVRILNCSVEKTLRPRVDAISRVVKVNIQLLRESGLSDDDVAKVCVASPRLLTSKADSVRAVLARAKELGVPRNSLMFRHVVAIVSGIGPATMAAKLNFIGEMLECSDAEVAEAVKKCPMLLNCSKEKLQRVSDFLTKVVGVNSKYILAIPTLLTYSIERRIAPRHYVMKVLLEKGLMRKEQSLYSLIAATDEAFKSRYIVPHKDVLPGLADEYASACKGNLPS